MMKPEKIAEVCDRYRKVLAQWDDGDNGRATQNHLLGMLDRIVVFVDQGRREKAMRWLGFVQGWLWAASIYTIEEMADHNRPDE